MDEISELTESQHQISLPIPNEDYLYRQVPLTELDRESQRFPLPANFTIKFDRGETELSCNWDRHIAVEEIYYIIGLSHNQNMEFKDYKKYRVIKLPIGSVRKITEIEKVTHSPSFYGNPALIGKPNIYSHASVFYLEINKVEARKKLSTYCHLNQEVCLQSVDFDAIDSKIDELRSRGQKTKYHSCKPDDAIIEPPTVTETDQLL